MRQATGSHRQIRILIDQGSAEEHGLKSSRAVKAMCQLRGGSAMDKKFAVGLGIGMAVGVLCSLALDVDAAAELETMAGQEPPIIVSSAQPYYTTERNQQADARRYYEFPT